MAFVSRVRPSPVAPNSRTLKTLADDGESAARLLGGESHNGCTMTSQRHKIRALLQWRLLEQFFIFINGLAGMTIPVTFFPNFFSTGFLNHQSLSRTKRGSVHNPPKTFPVAGTKKKDYHCP